MLCFYCTQTHMKLQSEFSREFLETIFARLPPLASAARCVPHPLATPLVRRRMRWPSKVTQRCFSNVPSVDLAFAMQITRCALKIGRGPALMARINIHEVRCVPLGLICIFMHGRSSLVLIAGASATPVRTQNSFIR